MKKIFLTVLLVSLIAITACDSGVKEVKIESDVYHQTMDKLSDIIVHDIFSPPVASRIYAYPSIAMYEVLAKNDPGYKSLAGQLNELTPIPDPKGEVSYDLAALEAFIKIGRTLIFRRGGRPYSKMGRWRHVQANPYLPEIHCNQ